MNLQIELPEQRVRQLNDLAEKQRVNRRRVDELLARVPAQPPLPGAE